MSESVKDEIIHLDSNQQEAVIGWMLKERQFMLKCKASLKPMNFGNPVLGELFSFIVDFAAKYDRSPTVAEVDGLILAKFITAKDVQERKSKMALCMAATTQHGLDFLMDRMTDWLKLCIMTRRMNEAANVFNRRLYDKSKEFVETMLLELREADFHQDERVKYDNPERDIDERNRNYENCCTIGHSAFDDLLRPGAAIRNGDWNSIRTSTKGGLVQRDMTVLLGPSNSGKTTTVISIIKQNILLGKFVIFVSCEQKEEDLKFKLEQAMMDSTEAEMAQYKDHPEMYREKLKVVSQLLEHYLVHISWIKPGKMFAEDVIDQIQLREEKLRNEERKPPLGIAGFVPVKPRGQGFDLLVCDYPGLLKSRIFLNKSHASTYDETGYVYQQFLNLGRSHGMHVLVPAQTNREGYKVARGDTKRAVDQGDMGDSWKIAQLADTIITINRGPKDQAGHTIKYYISKSRSGPVGYTFVSRTDFARSCSIGPSMVTCTFMPGEDPHDEAIRIRMGKADDYQNTQRDPRFVPQSEFAMPDSKSNARPVV